VTDLALSNAAPAAVRADALIVAVAKQGSSGRGRRATPPGVLLVGADAVDTALGGRLAQTLVALGATGGAGEVTKVPTGGALKAPVVVAVGLGEARDGGYDAETLRRAAGAAVRSLAGTARVAVAFPSDDPATVGAVAEGALLGAYTFNRYRVASSEAHKPPVGSVTVLTSGAKDKAVKAAAQRAADVVAAVQLTRDLVNTPPSDLPPRAFADAAVAAVDGLPVEVTVLDEKALRKGSYGGILGVGQGSANPPRLVRLAYRPRGAKRHLALVGKGITFDSGGLSLKPPAGMEWMKSDMGGAAAVIAAIAAIARLGVPVDVTAWAPMAENMPSGTAQRPSDVLTTYGGKTVEVLNTDAEGRLVLADALVAACEEKPDVVLDVATLTGAQLVALGSRTGAIMSNDDALRDAVLASARAAGEALWPMPLPDELRASMDSEVADIANMGDKYGGMLVAGLFLRDFVAEGIPWAHLDIAGPSFNQGSAYGYTPKGGTGHPVRTLVRVAEDLAAGRLIDA
jgi:leucyl aminopeptidase